MIARLQPVRTRRRITADEFQAMEKAGVFRGFAPATWHADDVVDGSGAPYLFTVEQYHRMIAVGILHEDERIELIRGEMLKKMAIGDPHIRCVIRLNKLLVLQVGDDVAVSPQNPIQLTDSEPEPDIVLYRDAPGFVAPPRPAETYLVVEVADSSIDDDLGWKAVLYAENAIAEYWVVDLTTDTVIVHRQPRPDGAWADVTTHGRGETLAVAALPGVTVAVAEILP
ncbi:MAG TPA: Uma2 family endonuclease [Gemmataceae bacterium]|nr:Uma2 family endonuclease [Gemmataceae bacterium]